MLLFHRMGSPYTAFDKAAPLLYIRYRFIGVIIPICCMWDAGWTRRTAGPSATWKIGAESIEGNENSVQWLPNRNFERTISNAIVQSKMNLENGG